MQAMIHKKNSGAAWRRCTRRLDWAAASLSHAAVPWYHGTGKISLNGNILRVCLFLLYCVSTYGSHRFENKTPCCAWRIDCTYRVLILGFQEMDLPNAPYLERRRTSPALSTCALLLHCRIYSRIARPGQGTMSSGHEEFDRPHIKRIAYPHCATLATSPVVTLP